jgi:hypothetical protein
MSSRSSKRAGYGTHRGSLNPEIIIRDDAPPSARNKTIWIKTSATKGIYVYDSATPTWTLIVSS